MQAYNIYKTANRDTKGSRLRRASFETETHQNRTGKYFAARFYQTSAEKERTHIPESSI